MHVPSIICYKIGIYSIKCVVMLHTVLGSNDSSTGTVVQTKPEGWRDAVQNTTSTSYCMSLTFHNKVGLTDNMMHGIDPYLY